MKCPHCDFEHAARRMVEIHVEAKHAQDPINQLAASANGSTNKPWTKRATVSPVNIERCPKQFMMPDHYRTDGTCKCVDHDSAIRRRDETESMLVKPQPKSNGRVGSIEI